MGQSLSRIRHRYGHRQRQRPVDWNTARNVQQQRPYQVYCRLVDPPVREPRVDPRFHTHFWKSPFGIDAFTTPEVTQIQKVQKSQDVSQMVVVHDQGRQYGVSVEPSEDDIHEDNVQTRNKLRVLDDQLNRCLWDAGDVFSESASNSSSEYDDVADSVQSRRRFSSSYGDPAAEEISLVQESSTNPWSVWNVPIQSYPPFLQPFINKPFRLYLRYANSNVAPHTMEKSIEAIYLMQNVKFLKVQFIQHSLGTNQMKISVEESHRAKRARKKSCFRPMYCKTIIIDCEHRTLTAIGEFLTNRKITPKTQPPPPQKKKKKKKETSNNKNPTT